VDKYLLAWVQHGHGMRSCTATHVAVVTRFCPQGKMLARAWSPPRLINTYLQFGTRKKKEPLGRHIFRQSRIFFETHCENWHKNINCHQRIGFMGKIIIVILLLVWTHTGMAQRQDTCFHLEDYLLAYEYDYPERTHDQVGQELFDYQTLMLDVCTLSLELIEAGYAHEGLFSSEAGFIPTPYEFYEGIGGFLREIRILQEEEVNRILELQEQGVWAWTNRPEGVLTETGFFLIGSSSFGIRPRLLKGFLDTWAELLATEQFSLRQ
jgi:hypothetical protein